MDNPHTDKQRNSLHLWLRKVTAVLVKQGYVFEFNGLRLQPTEALLKEVFRAGYTATCGHESTENASTTDYDAPYHAMIKFFGDQGIVLPPWPDIFSQAQEFQERLYGKE